MFVIMFGGLYTKMAALRPVGNPLQDGGWTSAIVKVAVALAGTAEAFLLVKSPEDKTVSSDHSMRPIQTDKRGIPKLLQRGIWQIGHDL